MVHLQNKQKKKSESNTSIIIFQTKAAYSKVACVLKVFTWSPYLVSKTYWLSQTERVFSETMKLGMLIVIIDINMVIRKCFFCALEILYHS